MNTITAQEAFRKFYGKPRGGYPNPHPGAINIGNAPIVIRPKGSRVYRPIIRLVQASA